MPEETHGTVRVRKWGHCMVIVLPPDLREFFAVVHRDMLAYRKVGRMVAFRRITAAELFPVTEAESQHARSGSAVNRE
jgi:hypothetical protein